METSPLRAADAMATAITTPTAIQQQKHTVETAATAATNNAGAPSHQKLNTAAQVGAASASIAARVAARHKKKILLKQQQQRSITTTTASGETEPSHQTLHHIPGTLHKQQSHSSSSNDVHTATRTESPDHQTTDQPQEQDRAKSSGAAAAVAAPSRHKNQQNLGKQLHYPNGTEKHGHSTLAAERDAAYVAPITPTQQSDILHVDSMYVRMRANCIDILKKPPHERKPQEISELVTYLLDFRKLEFFKPLDIHTVREVCRVLQYEKIPPVRWILRQGDPPSKMYCMFSGCVSVWVKSFQSEMLTDDHVHGAGDDDQGMSRKESTTTPGADEGGAACVARLEAGGSGPDTFGELGLLNGQRRTASVRTETTTELLSLDQESFIKVLKHRYQKDMHEKCSLMRTFGCLRNAPVPNLEKLSLYTRIRTFQSGKVLFEQGLKPTHVYFVLSGVVEMVYTYISDMQRGNALAGVVDNRADLSSDIDHNATLSSSGRRNGATKEHVSASTESTAHLARREHGLHQHRRGHRRHKMLRAKASEHRGLKPLSHRHRIIRVAVLGSGEIVGDMAGFDVSGRWGGVHMCGAVVRSPCRVLVIRTKDFILRVHDNFLSALRLRYRQKYAWRFARVQHLIAQDASLVRSRRESSEETSIMNRMVASLGLSNGGSKKSAIRIKDAKSIISRLAVMSPSAPLSSSPMLATKRRADELNLVMASPVTGGNRALDMAQANRKLISMSDLLTNYDNTLCSDSRSKMNPDLFGGAPDRTTAPIGRGSGGGSSAAALASPSCVHVASMKKKPHDGDRAVDSTFVSNVGFVPKARSGNGSAYGVCAESAQLEVGNARKSAWRNLMCSDDALLNAPGMEQNQYQTEKKDVNRAHLLHSLRNDANRADDHQWQQQRIAWHRQLSVPHQLFIEALTNRSPQAAERSGGKSTLQNLSDSFFSKKRACVDALALGLSHQRSDAAALLRRPATREHVVSDDCDQQNDGAAATDAHFCGSIRRSVVVETMTVADLPGGGPSSHYSKSLGREAPRLIKSKNAKGATVILGRQIRDPITLFSRRYPMNAEVVLECLDDAGSHSGMPVQYARGRTRDQFAAAKTRRLLLTKKRSLIRSELKHWRALRRGCLIIPSTEPRAHPSNGVNKPANCSQSHTDAIVRRRQAAVARARQQRNSSKIAHVFGCGRRAYVKHITEAKERDKIERLHVARRKAKSYKNDGCGGLPPGAAPASTSSIRECLPAPPSPPSVDKVAAMSRLSALERNSTRLQSSFADWKHGGEYTSLLRRERDRLRERFLAKNQATLDRLRRDQAYVEGVKDSLSLIHHGHASTGDASR